MLTKTNITLYHLTDIDKWNEIKKEGFVPGKHIGPFQCYAPHFTGTYGFTSLWAAKLNQKRMVDMARGTGFADKKYFPIIQVKLPRTPKWESRMRPDDDWSIHRDDWIRMNSEGSAVVTGPIPRKYIRRVG